MKHNTVATCLALLAVLVNTTVRADDTALASGSQVEFQRDIRPVLEKHCYSCHGPHKQEAGLRLDQRHAALRGGDSGKAILPGDGPNSRLIAYVRGRDPDYLMPPEGPPLSETEIRLLEKWIDQGASWPGDIASSAPTTTHWAYQPIDTASPPLISDARISQNPTLIRNEIDQFIVSKLDTLGLEPSPEADRPTLIRRLSLDLLGLLPSPAEVDAFVNDHRPTAYEDLVDRLLNSPHFGERWGRHWLDLARYADSDGYEKDRPRPDAYRWRDWVIDAINADMPFDQFTVEQLAGDLLPNATDMQRLATAFHRQTLTNTEGGTDQEQFRVEACFDRTETTGAIWLGLTVGCARCHSHKYEAISQREYYQLFSFFNNSDEQTHVVPKSISDIRSYEWAQTEYKTKLAALQQRLQQAPVDEQPKLKTELEELEKQAPPKPELEVRVLVQRTKDPRETYVLRRGEFLEPVLDSKVTPGGLATLPPLLSRSNDQPPDRLDLARWLVSTENPLTPRVAVNHVWRQLFGTGIVKTASDFGVRGEPPTHPELLDWLAARFIGLPQRELTDQTASQVENRAWSRKSLIKLIVMSATYRQSSVQTPELAQHDPQNQWLARQNRLRVEGEIVRDISLQVAGLLSDQVGGPSVFPSLPAGVAELSYAGNFKWTESPGADKFRRGMYTFFKRTSPHPNLLTFDCPDANLTCIQRNVSNTPLQALVALNNEAFADAARAFARRILSANEASDTASRLDRAFRLCMARPPSRFESEQLISLYSTARAWYDEREAEAKLLIGTTANQGSATVDDVPAAEIAAWTATSRVLMNLDEFITRE